jgi:hypothetical protein
MSTHNNYTVKRMLFKSKNLNNNNKNNNKKVIIIIIYYYYKPTRLMCFVHLNLEPVCGVTIGQINLLLWSHLWSKIKQIYTRVFKKQKTPNFFDQFFFFSSKHHIFLFFRFFNVAQVGP